MVTMLEFLDIQYSARKFCDPDKIEKAKRLHRTNCCNCGAPMSGKQCSYCGTAYNSYEVGDIGR